MRVRSLFVVVLSLLLPTSFGSITVAQSPTPEPRSAPGKVTVPLTKPDLPATEVVGFNDQGHSLTFQIRDAEVDPQDPQQEIYLYTVFYRDANQTWQNLCRGDTKYEAKAVVLQGSWDTTGAYRAGENLVTFSCANGALAKCARSGYKPWKTFNGQSLRDYHQACVRMVRADYCGDGTAHTKDGTTINLYDHLGIQKPDVSPGMQFEAAWGVNGAEYISHMRWPEDLAYVQRVCPERLASSPEPQSMTPRQVQQRFPKALVFNDSVVKTSK